METKVKALEKEAVRLGENIKALEEDRLVMLDYIAQMVFWFDNVVISISNKDVFDESDLDAIRDIKEKLEQFREDTRRDILVQQADEGKPQ